MAYEDFTTFAVNDPGTNLTIDANTIYADSVFTRDTLAYVYKDYGVDYFGDFDIEVATKFNEDNFEIYVGPVYICGVADTPADTYQNWNAGFGLAWYYTSGANATYLRLQNKDGLIDSSIGFNWQQWRYLKFDRAGATGTCKIYSDSARTVLVDTIAGTVPDAAFRYLYAYSARDINITWRRADTWTEDLEIISHGPVVSPYPVSRLRKDVISGYHCFMQQYMNAKREELLPLKLPDGTLW